MNKFRYLIVIVLLAAYLRFAALDTTVNLSNNILTMFFNVGSIIALWYFVCRLFADLNLRWLKEVSAFFLAISPWHIMLVNYPWQISCSIFIAILGSFVFINFIKNKILLFVSITILILLSSQFSKPFIFGIDNTKAPFWLTDEQRREHGKDYNNPAVKFLHNKITNYSLSFLDHYSEHFSGDFLFIAGDVSLNRKISDFGQMYLFDIVFLFTGILAIIKKFQWRWGIISLWLVLAPINSALTFTPPDSLRSALMIVPLIIISSFGVITLFGLIHKYTKGLIKYSAVLVILFLIMWDLSRFLSQCLFHVC